MTLNPWFSLAFLAGSGLVVAAEIVAVRRGRRGETITDHWRHADRWLQNRTALGRWTFRVFTAGVFTWALLHFLAGVD